MCAGTAVLLGFRRVLIGARSSDQGAEAWLTQGGIAVEGLDDPDGVALLQRLQCERPQRWRQDIGLPPA